MELRGLGKERVKEIVEEVSAVNYAGNLIAVVSDLGTKRVPGSRFTLQVRSSRGEGARRSGSGRRTVAACWHAHRDTMAAIFNEAPDVRLTTMLADYRGRDDFEDSFEDTGSHNVGSMMAWKTIRECCDCESEETELPVVVTEVPEGSRYRWTPAEADAEIEAWGDFIRDLKARG